MPDAVLRGLLEAAVPYALRLRRPFRGIEVREGVLIPGPSGWGEFAPFDDYDDAGAARWLDACLEAAFGSWPQARRSRIAVNAIIPSCSADAAAVLAREAVQVHGCTTVKVKVGGSLAEDEARVASVRDALDTLLGSGTGAIRIDANGAWSPAEAVTALRRLGAYGIEYAEQPCAGIEDLRELHRTAAVRIAVDEGLRRSDDPASVAATLREVADIVIIKTAPVGGVDAAMRLADAVGLPVVVSGALDSSVGLAAPLALAAALDLDTACGLGTGALLQDDLVARPLTPVDGRLAVCRPEPDPDALRRAGARLPSGRARWWQERLARAWAAGAGERWAGTIRSAIGGGAAGERLPS